MASLSMAQPDETKELMMRMNNTPYDRILKDAFERGGEDRRNGESCRPEFLYETYGERAQYVFGFDEAGDTEYARQLMVDGTVVRHG